MAPLTATPAAGQGDHPARPQPRSFGGWLLLLVVAQLLFGVHILRETVQRYLMAEEGLRFQEATYVTQFGLDLLLLSVAACVTVAMLTKLASFPALWRLQAFGYPVLLLVEELMAVARLAMPLHTALDSFFIGVLAGHVAYAATWAWYLARSKRVKATFVR